MPLLLKEISLKKTIQVDQYRIIAFSDPTHKPPLYPWRLLQNLSLARAFFNLKFIPSRNAAFFTPFSLTATYSVPDRSGASAPPDTTRPPCLIPPRLFGFFKRFFGFGIIGVDFQCRLKVRDGLVIVFLFKIRITAIVI